MELSEDQKENIIQNSEGAKGHLLILSSYVVSL